MFQLATLNFSSLPFQSESYDTLLGFNMETYRSCKTLWKACVEHHTFFRLHSPRVRRKFPLSLGSKFTYSGRTEFQTVSEVRQRGILERKFVRSPSKHLVSPRFLRTPCNSMQCMLRYQRNSYEQSFFSACKLMHWIVTVFY